MKIYLLRIIIFLLFFAFQCLKCQNTDSIVNVIKKIEDPKQMIDKYCLFVENTNSGSDPRFYDYMEECLSLSLKYKYTKGEIYALYLKGIYLSNIGNMDKAMVILVDDLKKAEAAKEMRWIVSLNISCAAILNRMGDFKNAKKYLDKGKEVLFKNQITAEEVALYSEYGIHFGMQNMEDSALKYQLLSLNNARERKNDVQIANQCINVGIAYKKIGKYDEAIKIYEEGEEIAKRIKYDYGLMFLLDNKAWAYFEKKMYDKSKELALNTLELNNQFQQLHINIDMYEVLQKIYTQTGNYKQAAEIANKLLIAKDSLYSQERIRSLNEVNAKYEVGIKDEKIKLQTENLKTNKKITIAISILSFLIIALIGIYFINSKRTNKKLTKLNTEIEMQKSALEQSNNVKSILFTVISHDLRSPLNVLKTFIHRLETGKIDQEKIGDYLKEISKDVNSTGDLIDNLLDWSQSQMQGYKTNIEEIYLLPIIENTIANFDYHIHKKSIEVIHSISENTAVNADKELTKIILRNLLANAIKYTPNGNKIYIDFNNAVLQIKDTGVGMNSEELSKLQMQELKISKRGTANEKGTGMGIMICKTFAEQMNCHIDFESEPGKGTNAKLVFGDL